MVIVRNPQESVSKELFFEACHQGLYYWQFINIINLRMKFDQEAEITITFTCLISTIACLIVVGFYFKIKQLRVEGFSNFILLIVGDIEWSLGNLL
jgi:hypothetical protein